MTIKRIAVSLFTIMICMMMFLSGYTKTATLYSYADSVTDEWQDVNTMNQIVEAFKYYCKSRDITIQGSRADALTQFTTRKFQIYCQDLGIDITALQAGLKYKIDSNGVSKFLYNASVIALYNRIFAQFLQDSNLSVGDTCNNDVIYSNEYFVDNNGNGCYVFVLGNTQYNGEQDVAKEGKLLEIGTPYIFQSTQDLKNYLNYTNVQGEDKFKSYSVSAGNTNYIYRFYNDSTINDTYNYVTNRYNSAATFWYFNYNKTTGVLGGRKGFLVIYKQSPYYYFGSYAENNYHENFSYLKNNRITLENNNNIQVINITVNTGGKTINNNNYEGDTIINNYGDPEEDTPVYNPYPDGGGTTNPPTNTGGGSGEDDGTITFPNFDFHLPEINWSLGDLSEKFPFSIPFDLIAFFTVLNAEPQAPAIDADIPLGSWYTWHFEADFSQFDNYAVIIRNVEFIGFCVGLIYLTIKLVKG